MSSIRKTVEKYTCRQLMKAVALNFTHNNNGHFKLFFDDLRPENVVVDKGTLQTTPVTDWEFYYTVLSQPSETIPCG